MLLAQSTPPPRYEFATLAPWIDEPGAITLVGLSAITLVAAIVLLYWRERSSLSPLRMMPLLLLRLGAVIGVVLYGLAPEKRDAQQQTRPSRVLLLVDDSLSMTLPSESPEASTPKRSRTAASIELLEHQGLLPALRKSHDVHVAAASVPRSSYVANLLTADKPLDKEEPATVLPDLSELLEARSIETRLGDALQHAVNAAASGPLAGVVLISDGQGNAGASPELAAAALGELGVPVYTIGVGSESLARNLAVRDVVAPRRAYPKDELRITAVIESQALEGETTRVTLSVRPAGDDNARPVLLDSKPVGPIAADAMSSVEFHVNPTTEGSYEYIVKATPLSDELDEADNTGTVEVQVVDRLLRVLLVAGGPTRDYHFLRDQLRRDDAFEVDVLLQSAPAVISQDADQVLTEFPTDEQELSEYDLVIAFDADWTRVPRDSIAALERCVSQRGAGFVFATGPVNTPRWLRESDASILLPLLPVKPQEKPVLLGNTQQAAPQARPVKLTRVGRQAPPLWVRGGQQASTQFWERQFPGFYSTVEVDSIKPAAMVYAQTDSDNGGQSRVVFAEQFYGAGRCFYIGAPELWRLRAIDPAALRSLYTKLLQHLAQGRLLAGAATGSLLFERDRYNVGDTLTLRATLETTEHQTPDELKVQLELPGGQIAALPMQQAESNGVWSAAIRAPVEGEYLASLSLPAAEEPLIAKAVVRVPALERSRTQRDARLLRLLSQQSGGSYYPSFDAVLAGEQGLPPLADAIPSRTETLVVYGAPDEAFAKRAAQWLLGVIAACLLTEWALRRFMGLA